MIVVSRDFPLDVVHTSIANLDGVFVANFVEGMCRWKSLFDDGQKLFSYVGPNIVTPGWVKPCHFPIPSSFFGGLVSGIGVKGKPMWVLTCLQSSLVGWNGCVENFFIGRDLREPVFNCFWQVFKN